MTKTLNNLIEALSEHLDKMLEEYIDYDEDGMKYYTKTVPENLKALSRLVEGIKYEAKNIHKDKVWELYKSYITELKVLSTEEMKGFLIIADKAVSVFEE